MNRSRLAAEFLGTFAIVFLGCGSIFAMRDLGPAAHVGINLVFGMTVASMIYALGHLSAAHFNPAVSIAFAVARRFPWRSVPGYIGAQLAGAILASALHSFLLPGIGSSVTFGATLPHLDALRAVVFEALLTFFLMLTIISVATDKRVNGAVTGLAIGGVVALAGLVGGPLTGCSMNPARSLGPAIFAGGPALAQLWIFFVGPILGASLAAIVYESIRGGVEHAQGAPNDLALALERAESST